MAGGHGRVRGVWIGGGARVGEIAAVCGRALETWRVGALPGKIWKGEREMGILVSGFGRERQHIFETPRLGG